MHPPLPPPSAPAAAFPLASQRRRKKKISDVFNYKPTYWGQNLGLGDDAVGQAVLPALGGDLGPGDLEARDPLVGGHPGNAPQETAGDVGLVDRKGGCQVLWFGKDLGEPLSCWEIGSLSQPVDSEKHLNVLGTQRAGSPAKSVMRG